MRTGSESCHIQVRAVHHTLLARVMKTRATANALPVSVPLVDYYHEHYFASSSAVIKLHTASPRWYRIDCSSI